jgi:hypothetical protein
VVDVFHGVNHPISVSIRNAVQALGPRLQHLAATMGDDIQSGLELVCHIIYGMQQDYFLYMHHVGRGKACDVPTFSILEVDRYGVVLPCYEPNRPASSLVLQARMSYS